MSRILITPRSFTTGPLHPELARLETAGHELRFATAGRVPTTAEVPSLISGCAAWIAGIEVIDRDAMLSAPELRIIARHGVGLDAIDLEAAAELGITVVPSTGSNTEGVAELVVLHALSLRRPHALGTNIDEPTAWSRSRGSELRGRTAAVIGYGAIGSRVAHLLGAFGMEIRVFDPFASPTSDHRLMRTLRDAVTGSDVVTLQCPPSDAPIIGKSEIAAFAAGATLINTARSSLVNLDAIFEALQSGHLKAYGCDVYPTEPPEPHPLWHHPNVLATPHLGGFTEESVQRSARMAVDAVLDIWR